MVCHKIFENLKLQNKSFYWNLDYGSENKQVLKSTKLKQLREYKQ